MAAWLLAGVEVPVVALTSRTQIPTARTASTTDFFLSRVSSSLARSVKLAMSNPGLGILYCHHYYDPQAIPDGVPLAAAARLAAVALSFSFR